MPRWASYWEFAKKKEADQDFKHKKAIIDNGKLTVHTNQSGY